MGETGAIILVHSLFVSFIALLQTHEKPVEWKPRLDEVEMTGCHQDNSTKTARLKFAFTPSAHLVEAHLGRSATNTPSGCLPFAGILSVGGRLLREAHQALIPRYLFRSICEYLRGLLTLEAHDGDKLSGGLYTPEQFPRKVAPDMRLLMALPVLMQGNHRIFFARPGPVRGKGYEHSHPPLRCQECALVPPGGLGGAQQKRCPSVGKYTRPRLPITSGKPPIFGGAYRVGRVSAAMGG